MITDLLIVEDLDSDYEMMYRSFRAEMHRLPTVERTRSVQETLSYLEDGTTPPRLIILDLHLVDGDAGELLPIFRQHPLWQAVPIIVWTANDDPVVLDHCCTYGADAFFRKVSDRQQAMTTVRKIITRWLNL